MTYCFECPTCEEHRDVSRPIKDSGLPEICSCGQKMLRDFHAEQTNIRGNYTRPIVSSSMAFDAQDAAEHRRRFPGVDLKIDGHTAHPILRSLNHKRGYMRKRGWVDRNSFT